MTEIADLQKRIVAFRDARDWQQFHNPKDSAISLLLEAAELLEHFQWKNVDEMQEHLRTSKQDVTEELADVLYWVLLMAHDFDIDLTEAVKDKMAKNEVKYPIHKAKGNHKKYTDLAKES
jgi:dCTP diphosphatase